MTAAWGAAPAGDERDSLVRAARELRWSAPEVALVLADRAAAMGGTARDLTWSRAQSVACYALSRLDREPAAAERAVPALRLLERWFAGATGTARAEMSEETELLAELRVQVARSARRLGSPAVSVPLLRPVLAAGGVASGARADALLELASLLPGDTGESEWARVLTEAEELCDGGEADRDATWSRRAAVRGAWARRQRRAGDLDAAILSARDGLRLLEQLDSPARDSGRVRGRLVVELVNALLDSGQPRMAVAVSEELLAAPARLPALSSHGWLRILLATRVRLPAGDAECARELLVSVAEDARHHRLDPLLSQAMRELSFVHERLAETTEALDCLRAAHAAERRAQREVRTARLRLADEFADSAEGKDGVGDLLTVLGEADRLGASSSSRVAGRRRRERQQDSPFLSRFRVGRGVGQDPEVWDGGAAALASGRPGGTRSSAPGQPLPEDPASTRAADRAANEPDLSRAGGALPGGASVGSTTDPSAVDGPEPEGGPGAPLGADDLVPGETAGRWSDGGRRSVDEGSGGRRRAAAWDVERAGMDQVDAVETEPAGRPPAWSSADDPFDQWDPGIGLPGAGEPASWSPAGQPGAPPLPPAADPSGGGGFLALTGGAVEEARRGLLGSTLDLFRGIGAAERRDHDATPPSGRGPGDGELELAGPPDHGARGLPDGGPPPVVPSPPSDEPGELPFDPAVDPFSVPVESWSAGEGPAPEVAHGPPPDDPAPRRFLAGGRDDHDESGGADRDRPPAGSTPPTPSASAPGEPGAVDAAPARPWAVGLPVETGPSTEGAAVGPAAPRQSCPEHRGGGGAPVGDVARASGAWGAGHEPDLGAKPPRGGAFTGPGQSAATVPAAGTRSSGGADGPPPAERPDGTTSAGRGTGARGEGASSSPAAEPMPVASADPGTHSPVASGDDLGGASLAELLAGAMVAYETTRQSLRRRIDQERSRQRAHLRAVPTDPSEPPDLPHPSVTGGQGPAAAPAVGADHPPRGLTPPAGADAEPPSSPAPTDATSTAEGPPPACRVDRPTGVDGGEGRRASGSGRSPGGAWCARGDANPTDGQGTDDAPAGSAAAGTGPGHHPEALTEDARPHASPGGRHSASPGRRGEDGALVPTSEAGENAVREPPGRTAVSEGPSPGGDLSWRTSHHQELAGAAETPVPEWRVAPSLPHEVSGPGTTRSEVHGVSDGPGAPTGSAVPPPPDPGREDLLDGPGASAPVVEAGGAHPVAEPALTWAVEAEVSGPPAPAPPPRHSSVPGAETVQEEALTTGRRRRRAPHEDGTGTALERPGGPAVEDQHAAPVLPAYGTIGSPTRRHGRPGGAPTSAAPTPGADEEAAPTMTGGASEVLRGRHRGSGDDDVDPGLDRWVAARHQADPDPDQDPDPSGPLVSGRAAHRTPEPTRSGGTHRATTDARHHGEPNGWRAPSGGSPTGPPEAEGPRPRHRRWTPPAD